ncbi:MAG TPA: carbohydrate ABC transporter permease [Candidatus Limnocylindrales bacterium]|nr:carbohydrate ABC transporter permease [Candidatus Limnocylindrales bacterium]
MTTIIRPATTSGTRIRNLRWGFLLRRGLQYGFLILLSAIILGPVLTAVLGGLKTTGELFDRPFGLPVTPRWENYTDILTGESFWLLTRNSFILVAGTSLGVVLCSSLLAFLLARVEFRGRSLLYAFISLGLLFPLTVAFLPVFIQIRSMGLTDNYLGVILPLIAFGIPTSTIILRSFFRTIPSELEDAAYIDGCTTFGFFRHVLFPLARPAIFAILVLQTIVAWNEYFLPLLILTKEDMWPLTLGIMQFRGQYAQDWGKIMAFVSILLVPAAIFYVITQRYIVNGLTGGELKG